MKTIHLTDEELSITRHGMTAYLRSFGHDEAETVVLIQAVLHRLAEAHAEPDRSVAQAGTGPAAPDPSLEQSEPSPSTAVG